MKRLACLALLPLLPLSAQDFEAGLFLGRQQYRETSATSNYGDQIRLAPGGWSSATALRLGWSCLDLGPARVKATAGYQFSASTPVRATGLIQGQGPLASNDTLAAKAFSLGAMFDFDLLLDAGAGLEYRFEHYDYQGNGTTAARPWARFYLGTTLPLPRQKPFIGLEADLALVRTSLDFPPAQDDLAKAVAPRLQVGVYGGVRF